MSSCAATSSPIQSNSSYISRGCLLEPRSSQRVPCFAPTQARLAALFVAAETGQGEPDAIAAQLKRRHKIWSGREISTFGFGRRSGVPAVVVIDPTGAELGFMPGEREGAAALREWEPHDYRAWPVKSEL